MEPEVILKMKAMILPDLLNLLWSAQEIKRGSKFFYEKLEEEILTRIRQVKDDDLQLLIECFSESDADAESVSLKDRFSDKFMELFLRVIREKKDRF